MKHFFLLLVVLLLNYTQIDAQQKLSPRAAVSVITCGPGNELYSAFGHSAFRIFDPLLGINKVYNYGTFDFNAPNFYLNFAKGKLTYLLSTTTFSYFLREYQYENRWVKSQNLDLTHNQVEAVFNFLENNAKPENAAYKYDFFYDNCATKIEQVIKLTLKNSVEFSNTHITTTKTQRDLIFDYTKNHKWAKFGIDLALGSVIDKIASKNDYKFLPDYIYLGFNNSTITSKNNTKPLVKNEQIILRSKPIIINSFTFLISPFFIIFIISLFIIYATFKNYKTSKRSKIVDFSIYFITGLIGIVVLLLWFATSHTATYKNFNFLWAFAPNIIIAFILLKTKIPNWVKTYNKLLLLLLISTFVLWLLKIQVFNSALISLIIALSIRYIYLISIRSVKN